MSDADVDLVLAGLDDARGGIEDLYRDLHAHPELSHSETRTAQRVTDALAPLGANSTPASGAPVSS